MKQAFIKKGKVVVEEIPAPVIDDNSVLVEVAFSLVSIGTETTMVKEAEKSLLNRIFEKEKLKKAYNIYKRKGLVRTLEIIKNKVKELKNNLEKLSPIGYSCSGIVLQTGKNVEGIYPGDKVACVGSGIANHAEIVLVPKNLVVKVPHGCDLQSAASVALGAIALQGIRRADVKLGETVAIIGLGLIGQLTNQLLKNSGCRTIGLDIKKERIELAKKFGLDLGLLASDFNVKDEVLKFTSWHGVDATIITASAPDNNEIIQQAMQITRERGKVIVVGNVGLALQRYPLFEKEIDLLISRAYGPGVFDVNYEEKGIDYPFSYVRWTMNRNMEEYLRLISEKKVDFLSLVEKIYDIENITELYQELTESPHPPLCTLLRYQKKDSNKVTETALETKLEIYPTSYLSKKGLINVALIGAGNFAKAFLLPALLKNSEFYTLRAIASKKGEDAKETAKKFGAKYCTTNYEDVLKDSEVDMVLIATRHNLHARIAIESAQAKKAIFLEKPMAINQDELDKLKEVLNKTNVPFMVGFNRRFSPAAVRLKEAVKSRKGPLFIIYRVNTESLPLNHWVYTEEGGGRIIGEACHMFDFFNFLTDSEPEFFDFNALTFSEPFILPSDNFVVTIKYSDGSLCTLFYTALGNNDLFKEYIEVYWDGKIAVIEDFRKLQFYGIGIDVKEWQSKHQDLGYVNELKIFAEYIKGLRTAPIPLEQLISATELSFQINEMVKSGISSGS